MNSRSPFGEERISSVRQPENKKIGRKIAKANYAFQAFEKKKENKKINEKYRKINNSDGHGVWSAKSALYAVKFKTRARRASNCGLTKAARKSYLCKAGGHPLMHSLEEASSTMIKVAGRAPLLGREKITKVGFHGQSYLCRAGAHPLMHSR